MNSMNPPYTGQRPSSDQFNLAMPPGIPSNSSTNGAAVASGGHGGSVRDPGSPGARTSGTSDSGGPQCPRGAEPPFGSE